MATIIPQNAEIIGGGGGGGDDQTAVEVPYSNTFSGLSGTNVQAALDEVAASAYIQDVTVTTHYLVLPTNDLILCNHTAPIDITLPLIPEEHKEYTVKDKSGAASTFPITVKGNGKLIDGLSTLLISSNYGSVDFIYDGTDWNAT